MMGQTKEHEVGIDPVCPHRAIVNLLHPVSTQCDLDPMCVPIELPVKLHGNAQVKSSGVHSSSLLCTLL